MRRHRILVLGLVLAAASVSCDDPASRRRVEAGRVLRAVSAVRTALGGVEQVLAVRSVSATARCSGPDGTVVRRIDARAPELVRVEEQASDGRGSTVICRPDGGWRLADGAATPVDPAVCAEMRLLAVHLLLLRYDLQLRDLAVDEEVEFAGQSCLRLSGRDRSGRGVAAFIGDAALPVGFRLGPPAGGGPEVVVDLSDWRRVGPVLLPHYTTITSDGRLWRCTFTGVAVNEVGESAFRVPGVDGP